MASPTRRCPLIRIVIASGIKGTCRNIVRIATEVVSQILVVEQIAYCHFVWPVGTSSTTLRRGRRGHRGWGSRWRWKGWHFAMASPTRRCPLIRIVIASGIKGTCRNIVRIATEVVSQILVVEQIAYCHFVWPVGTSSTTLRRGRRGHRGWGSRWRQRGRWWWWSHRW